jgi:hypothetical protein
MKPKAFSKKLVLNKKTIARLNNGDMKHAYGGTAAAFAIGDATECTNCTWTGDCCQTYTCGY